MGGPYLDQKIPPYFDPTFLEYQVRLGCGEDHGSYERVYKGVYITFVE